MSHKNKTTPTKILKLCQTSRIDLNKSMNGFVEKRKYDKRWAHLVGYTRCARLLFLESIVCIVILKQQVNSIIVQEQHYKRKTTYIRFLYAKIRPFEYTRMVGQGSWYSNLQKRSSTKTGGAPPTRTHTHTHFFHFFTFFIKIT